MAALFAFLAGIVTGVLITVFVGALDRTMTDFQLKDSGKREDFSTGSRRDTREDKGRFDLISPRFLRRLAKVLEAGAKKYGARNWERGQPLGRYLDSALRHINHVLLGDKDEDHAVQAAWNLHAFIHTAECIQDGSLPYSLDDLGYTDEEGEEALPDDTPDVAGSPPFTVNNPCGSPGCVICYPKEKEQSEAGLPATSSSGLSRIARILRCYLRVGPAPVAELFDRGEELGYTATEVFRAAHDELHVEYEVLSGRGCWRLPEEK